jgi:membrane associated rhomboid family serine protease
MLVMETESGGSGSKTAPTETWIALQRTYRRAPMAELSLVLTAMDIQHDVRRDGYGWQLWVPEELVTAAADQIARYRQENRPRFVIPVEWPQVDSGWAGVAVYLLVIWLVPVLDNGLAFGWDWREQGVMHAGAVASGEWWRTVTALTLHADLAHVVANSAFGAVFGLFVGRYLGSGFGWLLVVLAAALGNALNAWLQPDPFRSIGASTATFAALGLVAAFVWRRGHYRGSSLRRSFAPIFAGIAMLAFTGVGSERTDIFAHFFGFGCGVGFGMMAAQFDLARLGRSGQWLAGGCALLIVAGAWVLAGLSG